VPLIYCAPVSLAALLPERPRSARWKLLSNSNHIAVISIVATLVILVAAGTMDTNIAIRTLLTERGKIYCSVGGAITLDSQEQAEYQETLDKVARILPQLE